MIRKVLFLTMFAGLLAACGGASTSATKQVSRVTTAVITVYKSPSCECCGNWTKRLTEYGFTVETKEVDDMTKIKTRYGVPPSLQSCHTAVVDGYVVEGHVPPADIARLLKERPNMVGVTVPGMPVGSPGMEVEGTPTQPFDVLLFDKSGQSKLFATYR